MGRHPASHRGAVLSPARPALGSCDRRRPRRADVGAMTRLAARAAALPQSLVAAWLTITPIVGRVGQATYLARATGRHVDRNVLAAYLGGRRAVPQAVQALMRYEVLLHLLGTETRDAVAPVLEPYTLSGQHHVPGTSPRPTDVAQ